MPDAEWHAGIESFVVAIDIAHSRYLGRYADPFVADPAAISVRARRYAYRVQRGRAFEVDGPPLVPGWAVTAAAAAGLAVYALERYGFNHCHLARATSPEAAGLVRGVSQDPREDVGPGRRELQRRMRDASDMAQAVRLAEIAEVRKALADRVERDVARGASFGDSWLARPCWTGMPNHYEVVAWLDHAAALVHNMPALFATPRPALGDVRDKLVDAMERLAAASRPRRNRKAASDASAAEAPGEGRAARTA